MNLHDVFKIWRYSVYKGIICEHGGLQGGPGFCDFGNCKLVDKHTNVRYGCEQCPLDCLDFKECSINKQYDYFLTIYRNHKDYFDSTYDIQPDQQQIDEQKYVEAYNEDIYNRILKMSKRNNDA